MYKFTSNVVYSFLISLGVVLGASCFAGIGAILNNHPPMKTMLDLAGSIKIWAVAVAIGGTFSSLEVFDQGLLKGEIRSVVKQVIYILIALVGANLGYGILKLMQRCGELWAE